MLERRPYQEPGQRSRDEYVLTEAGRDFMPVVWAMFEWGRTHLPNRNPLRLAHRDCGAEATVEIRPDYFPALTRLAYLYYKQGFAVRAIDVWRRSLPYCTDMSLRANIETFVRRLIAVV